MKKNYVWCFVISWVISNIMCIYVTYKFASHDISNSAPNYVYLFYAIPFLIIIIGLYNYKKIHQLL